MDTRLLRYPCSYMIYVDAFGALPAAIKGTVYRRMIDVLSTPDRARHGRSSTIARPCWRF